MWPQSTFYCGDCGASSDRRLIIQILRATYRAYFLLGVGRGGMLYCVYVTLNCHHLKNKIQYVGMYFLVLCYCLNGYLSVIHSIKRKPYLSVKWDWYHFVTIAILHQSRPTDSADINTRLQLSDTSSIPAMHGGYLLLSTQLWCVVSLSCTRLALHQHSKDTTIFRSISWMEISEFIYIYTYIYRLSVIISSNIGSEWTAI